MKKLFLLIVITFGLFSAVKAQLIFNENFSYSAGSLTGVSGGNWVNVSGSVLMPVLVIGSTPAVPNYDGYASSGIGNIAAIQAGFTEDVKRSFTSQDSNGGNKIFAAALVNIANRTGLLTGATGDYFLHFTRGTTTFLSRFLVKSSGNGVQFGLTHATAGPQTFATTVYDTLKTYLIVMQYDFVPGTTNDVGRLWINPDLSGPVPAADVTQTVTTAEPAGFDGFSIRQGLNGPNAGIDGIRVGKTWEEVTGSPVKLAAFTQASTTSATISWKPPVTSAPAGYTTLVFVKQGSPITILTPTKGSSFYTANSDFSGTTTPFENDASAKNVYKGDDSSVLVTGLSSGNTYYVLVYSVKDADSSYSSAALTSGSIILNPKLSFSSSTSSVPEAGTNDTITVDITNANTVATSVDVVLSVGGGTATQGTDFTFPVTQTITFPASSTTSIQVIVPITNDAAVEGNETFKLKLQNPTNGASLGTDSIVVTIIDDDFNPSLSFNVVTQQVNEAADSVFVTVNISTPNANPTTVNVVVISGTATNGSDYTFSGKTLTFPASSSASQTFGIAITDDGLIEGNEYFKLNLQGATNGAVITSATDSVVIIDNDYNYYTIDDVNNVNGSGVPDSSGVKLGVRGIVYGINTGTPPAVTFFIRDNTGGIGAFSAKSFGYTVTEGDSVAVIGTVGTFRGLTQLSPLDTIILLGTGKPVKSPTVVTTLNETTEADYIKLNTFRLVNPSLWPISGANATLSIVKGTDTLLMFIDKETDIDGTPAPTGYFNVAGMGSQFAPTATAPFVGGYQIVPMRLSDIDMLASMITFTTTTQTVNEGDDTAYISVQMTVPSVAAVTVDVVISGGTATAGSDFTFTPATQTLTFPANTTNTLVIKIPIIDDAVDFEGSETIIVKLQNATAGTTVQDSIHTITITDNEPNGIGEITAATTKVFPNPSSGIVSMEANGTISSLKVFDVSGKEVSITSTEYMGNSVKADVSALQPGIYIMKAKVNGTAVVSRFIKQ